ncbi:MAG TPA: iron ABC transporter ATP-binding protein [Chloroflexi bacterium]|nr:iron ABC transporter ATP-binding protein [Chloroflexota bacterium]HHW85012.1 ABC transporter ATP-binding protein [Chloroflexota bacterium]
MLEVVDIHKRFAPDKPVLQGVSLTLAREEILCLLGPSGCGKSTLLRVIAGLEAPDQGEVRLHGVTITGLPAHRRGIGLMFQDYALFPHLDVAGNVGYGLRMAGINAVERRARVDALLTLVNLQGYAQRSVDELSGGEQQRVALARTLAPNPKLLLLDEPVANLDRQLRAELVQELRRILKTLQVTTIFVTHDQEEAFALADRIAVMRAGRIVQVDAPPQLYRRPANTFVAEFLGFRNLLPITGMLSGCQASTAIGVFTLPELPLESFAPGARLLIPPDAAVLDAQSPGATYVSFTGRVVMTTFRGSIFTVQVTPETGATDVLLSFEFRNRGRDRLPQVGETIRLWLDAGQMLVINDAA